MKERQVIVVTDASADLPSASDLKQRYGIDKIPQLPLGVNFGDTAYTTEELDHEHYSRLVHGSGHIPKTGALGPAVFTDFYSGLANQGKQILSIHLGDNMSAVGEQARIAAREIGSDLVEVYDSGTVSMALGFLAIAAEEAAMTGANREEIIRILNREKDRISLRVITPNMPYLRESGRVSHLTSMLGSLLRINPVLQIDSSRVENVAKARTTGGALDWMVNYSNQSGIPERVAIVDFEAEKEAETLAARLVSEVGVPDADIFRGRLGPITASHGGPGTLGLALVRGK